MNRLRYAALTALVLLLVRADGLAAAETRTGVVTAGTLNVRAKPARHFERVGKFSRGDAVSVVRETDEWLEILVPADAKAWVAKEHLDAQGKVTATSLQVRSGPGVVFTAYAEVPEGTELKLVGPPLDEWQQILPPKGTTGWVSRAYVRMVSPVAAAAKPDTEPAASVEETKATGTVVAKVPAAAKPSVAKPPVAKPPVVGAGAAADYTSKVRRDGETVEVVVEARKPSPAKPVAPPKPAVASAKPEAKPTAVEVVAPPKPAAVPPKVADVAPPKPAAVPPKPEAKPAVVEVVAKPKPAAVPPKVADVAPPKPAAVPSKVADITEPKPADLPAKPASAETKPAPAPVPAKVADIAEPPPVDLPDQPTPQPAISGLKPPVLVAEHAATGPAPELRDGPVLQPPIRTLDVPTLPRPALREARYEVPVFVAKATSTGDTAVSPADSGKPTSDEEAGQQPPDSTAGSGADSAVADASVPQPPDPQAEKPARVWREGILFSLGDQAVPEASHVLSRREGTACYPICYLRSTRIPLSQWEMREVRLYGKEVQVPGWSRPVIVVEGLQLKVLE